MLTAGKASELFAATLVSKCQTVARQGMYVRYTRERKRESESCSHRTAAVLTYVNVPRDKSQLRPHGRIIVNNHRRVSRRIRSITRLHAREKRDVNSAALSANFWTFSRELNFHVSKIKKQNKRRLKILFSVARELSYTD